MGVAVVTDSTSDLAVTDADVPIAGIVPLRVSIAGRPPVARQSIDLDELYEALRAGTRVTTSQPGGDAFLAAWSLAVARGADHIVSIHVASGLSGTVDRARSVVADCPVPVDVVDSRQVSGGLALQVIAAARVARRGGDPAAVRAAAAAVRRTTSSQVVVEDLAHLARGGRVAAPDRAGTPRLHGHQLLAVDGGAIVPTGRVRTWRRAFARLAATLAAADGDRWDVVVGHAAAPDRAAALLTALRGEVPIATARTVLFGPVVGAHVGPGAVGVAAAPTTRVAASTVAD